MLSLERAVRDRPLHPFEKVLNVGHAQAPMPRYASIHHPRTLLKRFNVGYRRVRCIPPRHSSCPGFESRDLWGRSEGITVRTRSLPMSIIGGLRTLFGGRVGIFSDLCESCARRVISVDGVSCEEIGR